MKKVVFTLVILSLIMCMLAFSVSAATTNEFGEIEYVSGMTEKSAFGEDGASATHTTRVVLYDGAEYHTYPSYYIFTNDTSNVNINFEEINSKTGKQYSKTSIIRAEVPHNVKKLNADVFWQNRSVKYVLLPDTLTEISGNTFSEAHGLEWVNIPRDCTAIRNRAFFGCASLKTVDMTNAKSLKRVEENQFYNCPNLEELIFPEGLEYFGGAGGGGPTYQNGLGSLKKLYLPDSVTYMGTIAEMKSIGTFVVPLGVTTLKSNQFSYCTGLKTIVVHKNVTSAASDTFQMTFYIENIVYTGENLETDNATVTALKGYTRNDGRKPTFTYGNHCEYYYDNQHLNDTNPCVINCERCYSVNVPKANPIHNETASISYARFDATGTKTITCKNEGCAHKETVNAPSLFICLGYSVPADGRGELAIGYIIDSEAILAYEQAEGNTVKYGAFAAAKDKIGTNPIFGENGEIASNVICAEISGYTFTSFELKIVGFAEDQKDLKLAMGAYVAVVSGNETAYSYLQDGTPDENEAYFFTSYNDIANSK